MPKPNPYSLKRPGDVEETQTFMDPAHPGVEFPVALCARSESSFEDEIAEKAAEFITDFIRGRNGGPPAVLPAVGGRPVRLTKRLCVDIAGLMVMEAEAQSRAQARQETAEEPYDLAQWVTLSATAPTAFSQMRDFAAKLLDQARGALLGNESRAAMEPSSESPSTTEPATIPSS